VIPEEREPPPEIAAMQRYLRESPPPPGLVDAVIDPALNALVAGSSALRPALVNTVTARRALAERLLRDGPDALTASECATLLDDPLVFSRLHERVRADAGLHPAWPAALAASGCT